MQNIYYVYTLFAASSISILISYFAWKKKPAQGAVPLAILMLSIAMWALFQGLSFSAESSAFKLIFANMRYFGVEVAPIAFYAFAYEYKDRVSSVKIKIWYAFLAFPLVMVVLLWTNMFHNLFYTDVFIENGILILRNGLFFWINMMYLYVFIVSGMYIFVIACLKYNSIYRRQTIIMTIASFIPVTANLVFNFSLLPIKDIDITPLAFLFTGILFFVAMAQYKLLDLVPVARESLFEDMEDAVIVLDSSHRILDLNKKARELVFADMDLKHEVIGRDIIPFLDNWKDLSDFIACSQEESKKVVNNTDNGPEYYYLRTSSFYYKQGNQYGQLLVLRNISELEQALQEIRAAKEEAESASKAKSNFLANMSHEIRTPMNAIVGIAEILDTMDLTKEEQKRYIKIILNSTNSLLTIINDILDFSKIEAGKLDIEKNPFDLGSLIIETAEAFSILAASKSLNLDIKVDQKLERMLIGDYIRIRQVLSNLIGNSIKFTERGYVRVSAEVVQKHASDVLVNITVSDSGVGIPKEQLDIIFESFKQVDSSATRKFGGTGLGLSIAKNLTELMGGKLTVESETGQGSSFCCSIPFQIVKSGIIENKPADKGGYDEKSLSGLKILVADDNKVNREIVGIRLKKWGCEIDYAVNGVEALERFEKNKYDVILMDVQMPEMDGLEAARKIREREKATLKHINIIALTADVLKDDVEKCINSGMDTHLPKPVKTEMLHKVLLEIAKLQ